MQEITEVMPFHASKQAYGIFSAADNLFHRRQAIATIINFDILESRKKKYDRLVRRR